MSEKIQQMQRIRNRVDELTIEKKAYSDTIFNELRVPTIKELDHMREIQLKLDNLNIAFNMLMDREDVIGWEKEGYKIH